MQPPEPQRTHPFPPQQCHLHCFTDAGYLGGGWMHLTPQEEWVTFIDHYLCDTCQMPDSPHLPHTPLQGL